MSDEETSSEDLTILAAVEAPERGIDPSAGAARRDEDAETLARLYTEVLGLLPYDLEPVEPSPEVRERLMATIHGDETQPAAGSAVPMAAATRPRSAQEVRVPRPVVPAPPSVFAPRQPAPRRWPLALAATLCFLLLGLSAWLYLQLGQQRQTIAQLQRDIAAERARAEQAAAGARNLQASEPDLREKLALVTSRAVQVSPMRPVGRLQPEARGVLFVAADHQHWYLSLEGLPPAEAGKAYKLWFVADGRPVSGGSFTAQPGAPIELSSKSMPAGTKDAIVTLESDPAAPAPAGPEILRTEGAFVIG